MQTQPLQFAKPQQVSSSDFFSGAQPTPTPEVLAIGEKYRIAATDEPQAADEPVANPFDFQASSGNLGNLAPVPEIGNILDKYKGTEPPPLADVTKDAEPNQPKQADFVAPSEAPQVSDLPLGEDVASVATMLQEKGFLSVIPEDFPMAAVTTENLWELIELNFNQKVVQEFESGYESARTDLSRSVSDETLDILNYQLANPNASKEEVRYHIDRILYAKDVADLDPADPTDAEIILRQYLSFDCTPEEVAAQIAEAIELNRLEQRASMWKPKVVQRAQAAVQQDRQRQAGILEQDRLRHQEFLGKVDNALKANTLLGIPLGQEEKARVRAILGENNMPVPVNGGQTVELGLMEYLVSKNKYGRDGNVENLIMAALILDQGPKVLEKYITAPVTKAAAVKFEAQKATGSFSAAPSPSRTSPQTDQAKKKEIFWSRFKKVSQ